MSVESISTARRWSMLVIALTATLSRAQVLGAGGRIAAGSLVGRGNC